MKRSFPNTIMVKTAMVKILFIFLRFFIILFFWCGLFLKSLLNLFQFCFHFLFWFFGHKACGILVSWAEIEPAPPALKGEFITTGPPEKSPVILFIDKVSVKFLT